MKQQEIFNHQSSEQGRIGNNGTIRDLKEYGHIRGNEMEVLEPNIQSDEDLCVVDFT